MKIINRRGIALLLSFAFFNHSGLAQEAEPKVSIKDVAWIAGQWRGQALGASFEETWNKPAGGSMMGMFKLFEEPKDGKPKVQFYELLTIVEKDDSLLLRLKHFGKDLEGWEAKDKSVEFPLLDANKNEAIFEGLKFRRLNDFRMDIEVVLGRKGGKPETALFRCHRVIDSNIAGPKSEIQNVLMMDSVLSAQRNLASRTKPLHVAIENYLSGLSKIDFSECPSSFAESFALHRAAWQKSIPFFKKHDGLRGEMHELLDEIREQGDVPKLELAKYFGQIMSTWSLVEADSNSPRAFDLLAFADTSMFKATQKWQMVNSVNAVDGQSKLTVREISDEAKPVVLINGQTKNGAPYLFTKEEFSDVRVQLEFMVPSDSNSGVYLMGRYEVQILDSFGKPESKLRCADLGGIYERTDPDNPGRGIDGVPPKLNAALKPGEWQTLDIVFRAPVFDKDGKKTKEAKFDRVTVNGKLVQQNQSVKGPTVAAQFEDEVRFGPISIQGDHGPIAIRKFVVTPLL